MYRDVANDVALLRVNGLQAPSLATRDGGDFPKPVVLLGYPRDGALTATAGTAGEPRTVLAPDAYRNNVRPRRSCRCADPLRPVRAADRLSTAAAPSSR